MMKSPSPELGTSDCRAARRGAARRWEWHYVEVGAIPSPDETAHRCDTSTAHAEQSRRFHEADEH